MTKKKKKIYPTEYETSRKTKMLYFVIKDIASNINRGLFQVYSGTEKQEVDTPTLLFS